MFKYVGSVLSEDGRCESEIRARIGMAKANFGKMRNLMTNPSLDAQQDSEYLGAAYGMGCCTGAKVGH